mgnify:CR=1 FL=1
MKVTNHEILRPKINNIESIENDTLYQRIKNDPTTNSAIQCLTELLQRQEKQIQNLKEELTKIINKHFNHWSQYSPTIDYENTKNKFENIYAKNNIIPFGITLYEENNLIGFLVFKTNCLEKYPEYILLMLPDVVHTIKQDIC